MSVKYDKGYRPDPNRKGCNGNTVVQLRFDNHGVDFIESDLGVDQFIFRVKARLDGMIRYHKSLDINDTQFLAERLYLGEGVMLNLAGRDGLVYLGSHRTHRNFVDKFGL